MKKIFQAPSVEIVRLNEANIITTSPGDSTNMGVTDTNVDSSDKSPWRSPWGDD